MFKITIEFPTKKDMDDFLGQLSDGAMENMCDIRPKNREQDFWEATEFELEMIEEWWK